MSEVLTIPDRSKIWQRTEEIVDKKEDEYLATIDANIKKFDQEIENLDNGTERFKTESRVYFGFPEEVQEPITQQDIERQRVKFEQAKSRFQQLNQRKKGFLEHLTGKDLAPICIMPYNIWHNLLAKTGLYRFEGLRFDRDQRKTYARINLEVNMKSIWGFFATSLVVGFLLASVLAGIALHKGGSLDLPLAFFTVFVLVSTTSYLWEADQGEKRNLMEGKKKRVYYSLRFIGFILATSYIYSSVYESGSSIVKCAIVSGFVAAIVCILIIFIFSLVIVPCGNVLAKIFWRVAPKGLLIKAMWPKKNDSKSGAAIPIEFPRPGRGFHLLVKRVVEAGYQPCVAAVPEAIGFSRGDVLSRIRQKELAEREARRVASCPILYVVDRQEKLVAVIAQYGKFTKEQKLVRSLQKMDLFEEI